MKIDNSGQILVEVLVAMAIASVVIVLGSQLILVSLSGNKIAGDSNVASGLANETLEAVRAVATENWLNVYSLTHGSTKYYPQKIAGAWTLVAGTENILLNNCSYSRHLTVQNVCRDVSTRLITGLSDNSGSDVSCNNISGSGIDPSTQKINVSVVWAGASIATSSEYISRWRNKTCSQTSWSSAGGSVYDCPSTFYGSTDGNIITGENLHL